MSRTRTVPKVSVSIITYNHRQFIARALDSVLSQKRNFEIEIIVGDDFSTDGTQDILKRYQQEYPDIIHLILHPKHNPGIPGRTNNITNIYACRGKYVAMLDGDDYWTDDHKLQSQVDFLDGDDTHSIIGHTAERVTPLGEGLGTYWKYGAITEKAGSYTLDDILDIGWCFAQTSTLMFRNQLFAEFPEWFREVVSADFVLLLLLARHGDLKYVTRPMTGYTVHDNSFMAKHYRSRKYMSLKINELRLLKNIFLSGNDTDFVKKRKKRVKGLNKMIASYKYAYSRSLHREKKYFSGLAYLFRGMFSDSSLPFFASGALRNLRSSIQ
jgi:glycosyltransferase involved in cell wall biosynthesis